MQAIACPSDHPPHLPNHAPHPITQHTLEIAARVRVRWQRLYSKARTYSHFVHFLRHAMFTWVIQDPPPPVPQKPATTMASGKLRTGEKVRARRRTPPPPPIRRPAAPTQLTPRTDRGAAARTLRCPCRFDFHISANLCRVLPVPR